jgi:hypothetical protein
MPNPISKIGRKVDEFFTNYLRNTTTDQEILNFYGEGNVIGRKGIPSGDKELLDSLENSRNLVTSPLRPTTDRPNFSVGSIDQEIGYNYTTRDIPKLIDPNTGRNWQMTFGTLPKDFGSGSLTPAANQFLVDFRVPRNSGSDYSFATGPNIKDRVEFETKQLLENDPYFGRHPKRLNERVNEIKNKPAYIGEHSGQPMTPKTWQDLGYISEKPANFKEGVLNEFKNRIFETQGPFGGVSTLTPVEQHSANNPLWRADLYEKARLAGPVSEQGFSSGYGGGSRQVQRFTTGNDRLLPLQPYSEFFKNTSGATPASVIGSEPAPDFTPFQRAVGTRNYLIGKNIFEGRGNLGSGFRSGASIGAIDLIPSSEAVKAFYQEGPQQGLTRMAGDFVSGIPTALSIGATLSAVPALAPAVPGVALGAAALKAGEALDEVSRQQTGEGIVSKLRQTLGTEPRSGVASRSPTRTTTNFVTPTIRPQTPAEKSEINRRSTESEWDRRLRMAQERFNPAKGEFGFTELFFGR